ncbi:hypothetical protein B0H10DRAFT_2166043 [Mycena sp. CBHHK59/15]|nr:hypothetical protein B0H10DRAFT_2166043 [Mycena sp. CBHHK59/15]
MPHGTSFTCPVCLKTCVSHSGLSQHQNSHHQEFTPASHGDDENTFQCQYHLLLTALPCNAHGIYSPQYTAPPPPPPPPPNGQDPAAWDPFSEHTEINFVNFHFNINTALDLWAAMVLKYGGSALWKDARELYTTIDSIKDGQAFPLPAGIPLKWMTETYELCTQDAHQVLHNQLGPAAFKDHVNLVPYRQFNYGGKCIWSNQMSVDWAWKQADLIVRDPQTHGTTFVAVVAGRTARCAYDNGILPGAFLPILKTNKKHCTKPAFQKFVCQMYHACLAKVFQPLKLAMMTPEVVHCPDGQCAIHPPLPHGHLCQVVYGLGPYIADYLEQVWLTTIVQNWCPKCDVHPDHLDAEGTHFCSQFKTTLFDPGILWDDFGIHSDVVPFTSHFPCADIHELLSSDLLHQVIKGTFKDHLVSWVNEYFYIEHGEKRALEIIQDLDHRISADFSQWIGNDSKALIKIYLAAVAGYLPSDMVKCLLVFMEFCYLYFPAHYLRFIQLFGSPNGHCSSIMESKHIKAALPQMLVTISCLDKMAAFLLLFCVRGMMVSTISSYTAMVLAGNQPQVAAAAIINGNDDKDGKDDHVNHGPRSLSLIELALCGYPNELYDLAAHIIQPCSMSSEHIRSNPSWHGYPHCDMIFIDTGSPVMGGLVIGHVILFFSFIFFNLDYKCTLVSWPDPDTGMWVVEPEVEWREPCLGIVKIDYIACAAHLIGVYGFTALPEDFHFSSSLDAFDRYFVNPYADHHIYIYLIIVFSTMVSL